MSKRAKKPVEKLKKVYKVQIGRCHSGEEIMNWSYKRVVGESVDDVLEKVSPLLQKGEFVVSVNFKAVLDIV